MIISPYKCRSKSRDILQDNRKIKGPKMEAIWHHNLLRPWLTGSNRHSFF